MALLIREDAHGRKTESVLAGELDRSFKIGSRALGPTDPLHQAIAVCNEDYGKLGDTEARGEDALIVDNNWKGKPVLPRLRKGIRAPLILGNSEKNNVLTELPIESLILWKSSLTRFAPACKELYDHDTSAKCGRIDGVAMKIGPKELGEQAGEERVLAPRQGRACTADAGRRDERRQQQASGNSRAGLGRLDRGFHLRFARLAKPRIQAIRSVVESVTSAALLFGCVACASAYPNALPPPDRTPDAQKCMVAPNRMSPMIIGWDSAERASLEARMSTGLVVVRYDGCEMEVLRQCSVPGNYQYKAVTAKKDRVEIKNEADLYANLALSALKFLADLNRSKELDLQTSIVGQFQAPNTKIDESVFDADECSEATHLISAVQVGSFHFTALQGVSGGGEAGIPVAGLGGSGGRERRDLASDGDAEVCRESSKGEGAPQECALIRLELVETNHRRRQGARRETSSLQVAGGVAIAVGAIVGSGLLAGGLAVGAGVQDDLMNATGTDRESLITRGSRANAVAYTGGVILGLGLISGAGLLLAGRRKSERMQASFWGQPNSGGIAVMWRF